ncbi:MAG: PEP-CTERM sorting domain-containing protein [Limisphaerales bacterium]
MKALNNQTRTSATLALAAVAATLAVGIMQAQAQSVEYTFSDGTSDGWADSGFSATPVATVSTIGSQNYAYIPYVGFQSGNVGTGYAGNLTGFDAAMAAALNNPSAYDLSYTYYINTATFSGATFLQLGTFLNAGSGYYSQDYSTPNEVQFTGAQLSSGQVFTGTVTINMGSVFSSDSSAATETFYRLGLIENTDSTATGVGVYYTDISVTPVPEPGTLVLAGLGGLSMLFLRRRKA